MPEHMITKLEKQLNITFTNKQEIPMRWIKGNSPVHIDKSKTHLFDTTHLIYVTDCVGNLVVNGEKYSITAGTAYIFEEGLEHETIGTEDSARLLIGPMSEIGILVGMDWSWSGPQDYWNYESSPAEEPPPPPPPPPCSYSEWNDSGSCSVNCGGGTKKQTRTATNNGANDCNEPTTQNVPCNTQACPPPPPCNYSEWNDTSTCPSCGTDQTKSQMRAATTTTCTGDQKQTRTISCDIPACPTCNYGKWSEYSTCSKPCNGGTQTRTRTKNPIGSIQCNEISETINCNTQTCPPCEYGEVESTNACSVECGGGTQSITYKLVNKHGNDYCPQKIESKPCNIDPCADIMNVITPTYDEYWSLYLDNKYNSASFFTITENTTAGLKSYTKIKSLTQEECRAKLQRRKCLYSGNTRRKKDW